MVAVGNGGHIVFSTDGGASWAAATQAATTANLTAVCWAAGTTWFATTVDGRLLTSASNGATWSSVSTSAYAYTSVSFQSTTLGLAVAKASGGWIVRRTTNGGTSWTNLASSENVDVLDVKILSTSTAYLVTASGSMWRTGNISAGTPTWTMMGIGQFTGRSGAHKVDLQYRRLTLLRCR